MRASLKRISYENERKEEDTIRKVFLSMTMTCDGFFCGPNGELDWMSRTAQTFVRLGLIDEYMLMVHPVAIGKGQSVFTKSVTLELVSAKTYRSGVIRVHYQPR